MDELGTEFSRASRHHIIAGLNPTANPPASFEQNYRFAAAYHIERG